MGRGMNSQSKISPVAVGVVLALVVVIGAGFWYWRSRKVATVERSTTQLTKEAVSVGFGAQVLEKSQNPIKDRIPETNPFEKNANPLRNVYKNPFR